MDGVQELRDMLGQHLDFGDEKVVDYVGRIDGEKWVGVVLTDGIGNRERLVEKIETADDFSVEFTERLDERLFQSRRLGEFSKFWNGEIANAKPKYTLPKVDAVYDWNRENKYIESSYAKFFPDDVEAGARLDQLVKNPSAARLTDREILDAFRAGLKRAKTSPNSLMSFLTNALGWPGEPYQTEILYHAAALDAPHRSTLLLGLLRLGNLVGQKRERPAVVRRNHRKFETTGRPRLDGSNPLVDPG